MGSHKRPCCLVRFSFVGCLCRQWEKLRGSPARIVGETSPLTPTTAAPEFEPVGPGSIEKFENRPLGPTNNSRAFLSGTCGHTHSSLLNWMLGQCIMKERPLQKVEAGCGAASAALRCAGLRSATAALRSNCGGVSGAKGLQESIGKSAGEWHFTLGERDTLARMTFPPRRQLK